MLIPQAVLELRDTNRRMKVAEGQIDGLKKEATRASLTDEELSKLPDDVVVYKSVGRA